MKKIFLLLNILLISLSSCNNNVDAVKITDKAIDVTKSVKANRKIDKKAIKKTSTSETEEVSSEENSTESDKSTTTTDKNDESDYGIIEGIVVDTEAVRLPGVDIYDIKNLRFGTTSDFDGKFSIKMPAGVHIIKFSYVGYKLVKKSVMVIPEITKDLGTIVLKEKKNNVNKISAEQISNGENIFKKSSCLACHQLDKKIGSFPAVKTIASVYSGKRDKLFKFLKGESLPIVDPNNFNQMKPYVETIKKLNDSDLNALVDYILSRK